MTSAKNGFSGRDKQRIVLFSQLEAGIPDAAAVAALQMLQKRPLNQLVPTV